MAERKFRTREQKLADARSEIIRIEQATKDQAIRLRTQAQGWITRSKELLIKAEDAEVKSDQLLASVGIDPTAFWAEHDSGTEEV